MQTNNLKFILTLLMTIIFNYFFWEEYLGINLMIFSCLLTGMVIFLNPDTIRFKSVKITLAGTLISGLFLVIFNSAASKLAHIVSLTVTIGFVHQTALKTVYFALIQLLHNSVKAPLVFWSELSEKFQSNRKFYTTFSYLRLSIIPLIVLAVFYFIYQAANPVFAKLSSDFWYQVLQSFEFFFYDFSMSRIMFLLIGLWIIATCFFNQNLKTILNLQLTKSEALKRVKNKLKKIDPRLFTTPENAPKISLALKNQLKSGVLLLVMVNLLLLIVNIIDVQSVWLNFNVMTVQDLRQFVHEGTYMLILSIFLSMLILLYYFKGNLNFHSKNNFIKILSYSWIVQNAFLAASVGVRNYHYIHEYGLAYKRIGVIIFLLLTIFGLITLYFKIKLKRSAYYLYKTNSWALYAALILMSLINWDVAIARYNIEFYEPKRVDKQFLLSLSDKTLHIMLQNRQLFQNEESPLYDGETYKTQSEYLHDRVRTFLNEYPQRSWLSWNYAEEQTYQNLKNMSTTNTSASK